MDRIEIGCGSDGIMSTIAIDGVDPGDELRAVFGGGGEALLFGREIEVVLDAPFLIEVEEVSGEGWAVVAILHRERREGSRHDRSRVEGAAEMDEDGLGDGGFGEGFEAVAELGGGELAESEEVHVGVPGALQDDFVDGVVIHIGEDDELAVSWSILNA